MPHTFVPLGGACLPRRSPAAKVDALRMNENERKGEFLCAFRAHVLL